MPSILNDYYCNISTRFNFDGNYNASDVNHDSEYKFEFTYILILQYLNHGDYIHIIRTSCVSNVIVYVCKDVFNRYSW